MGSIVDTHAPLPVFTASSAVYTNHNPPPASGASSVVSLWLCNIQILILTCWQVIVSVHECVDIKILIVWFSDPHSIQFTFSFQHESLTLFSNLCSQSIFSAVAFYMKHLGVKTRAVDSKKSRGGFFRRQLVKVSRTPAEPLFFSRSRRVLDLLSISDSQNKKDESTKTKPRGGFPGIPSWIAGNRTYLLQTHPAACFSPVVLLVSSILQSRSLLHELHMSLCCPALLSCYSWGQT